MAKPLVKPPAVSASVSADLPGRLQLGQTNDSTPTSAETRIVARRSFQYQYRCRVTGAVKAYKKMTSRKAAITDLILEAQNAHGRWVLQSAATEAYRQGDYRPVNGFAEEGSAANDGGDGEQQSTELRSCPVL